MSSMEWIRTATARRASIPTVVGLAAVLIAIHPARAGVNAFTEEAIARGVVYEMGLTQGPTGYGYVGFGCAIVDLDDDGDQDLVIIGGDNQRVGLFRNDGLGQFTDVSLTSGIPILQEGSALAIGDYDGDGLLDIYLTEMALPNKLMRNNGNLQFTNTAVAAGVADAGGGKGASFGDFDGDGWLDLYVNNYNGEVVGFDNKLYQNRGDGTFNDVSVAQGVDSDANSFQSVWSDFDLDGDLDLYISNDRGASVGKPNELYRNDAGSLVDVSVASGADVALDSMGLACGDLDGNGWPDFYLTNVGGQGGMNNPLLLNQGDGTFVRAENVAGIDGAGAGTTGWGAIFFDYENDGTLDLYVNYQFHPNELYSCAGGFPCTNQAAFMNVAGPSGGNCVTGVCSWGSAVGDVDNDGDLDLLVNNTGENVRLYINQEGETRSWIRYRVVGELPNKQAIGARVNTRTGTTWQWREILAGGNSYLGVNEFAVHVGLGSAAQADEVEVHWPGGAPTRILTDLPANQVWTIYRPDRLGDVDNDGSIDSGDFPTFADCVGEIFAPGCEIMDLDGDSDVDCVDYDLLLGEWTGGEPVPPVFQCTGTVPAASGWGLIAMALCVLVGATLLLEKKCSPRSDHAFEIAARTPTG